MTKKVLLICSAGMSTSMLVKKMSDYARKNQIDIEAKAMGMAEAKPDIKNWDCVMIGPQVSFILKDIKQITTAPVELIPASIYALAKGEEAVKMALKMLGN